LMMSNSVAKTFCLMASLDCELSFQAKECYTPDSVDI
jgi:hypothetical protein